MQKIRKPMWNKAWDEWHPQTKGLFFIAGLILASLPTFSQQNPGIERDFFIAIGFTNYQIRDQLVNNIRHQGDFGSLSLFHRKTREGSLREIRGDLLFNPLRSRYEDEIESMITQLGINYRYLWNLTKADQTLKLYIGPVAGFNWRLYYFGAWDESHVFWVSTYFAGVDGRVSFHASERVTFSLDANLPLAVLVSRPPERFLYKELNPTFGWMFSRLHDDMQLTSLHRHLEVNTTLDLVYALSPKFKPGLFWRFNYVNNELPGAKGVNMVNNTIGAYLIF